MRRAIMVLVAMVATAAGAQALHGPRRNHGARATGIRYEDFRSYFVNPATPLSGQWIEGLGQSGAFTRATVATCLNSAGVMTKLVSGQRCVNERGLLLEPAETNQMTRSEEADQWTAVGSAVVSANSATCGNAVDGTQTADLVTTDGTIGHGVTRNGVTAAFLAGDSEHRSIWVWVPSGDTSCHISIGDPSIGGEYLATLITSTPQRVTHYGTAGATTAGMYLHATTIAQGAGPYCARWCQWGAMIRSTPNVNAAVSYIPTAASAVVRNYAKQNASLSGSPARQPLATGTIELGYTPEVWSATGTYTLFDNRGASGNNVGYRLEVTSNTLKWSMGTSNIASSALTWTQGTNYKVKVAWDGVKACLYRDNVLLLSSALAPSTSNTNTAAIGSTPNSVTSGNGWFTFLNVYNIGFCP